MRTSDLPGPGEKLVEISREPLRRTGGRVKGWRRVLGRLSSTVGTAPPPPVILNLFQDPFASGLNRSRKDAESAEIGRTLFLRASAPPREPAFFVMLNLFQHP